MMIISGIRCNHRKRTWLFSGILFFAFAINTLAGCLYKFARVIVEPEKAMAGTYAVIGPLILMYV